MLINFIRNSNSDVPEGSISSRSELTATALPRSFHVVFAIEQLYNASGGAERVLADVTQHLYDRGHRVTVLTYEGYNGPSFYKLRFGVERVDACPRHSPRKNKGRLNSIEARCERNALLAMPFWVARYLPRIFRLRRALREVDPDVVVAFMPSMFTYTTLAAIGLRTKTVVSVHNVPTREFGSDRKRWSQNLFDIRMRRLSLRLADAVTVLLPSFKAEFKRDSVREKAWIIPNMINLKDVSRGSSVAAGPHTILAVGRLAEAKDHATLISAWKLLEEDYPDWSVKIIGHGPLKGELSKMIQFYGLRRLSIQEPTTNIVREYSEARILAMPSKYEGFGLVTAEALSCGLPVVGFADCPGTNELVQHNINGLLAQAAPDRAASLAKELATLMQDATLRSKLAANASASVASYAPSEITRKWEELLQELAFGGATNG